MRKATIALLLAVTSVLPASERLQIRLDPRFWGATFRTRYALSTPRADAVETWITAMLSGAYETVGYYRNPDGSFHQPSAGDSLAVTTYNRVNTVWELGIRQGLLSRPDDAADRAVAFVAYRGVWDLPSVAQAAEDPPRLFFASGLPEADGALRGAVVSGLAWSTVRNVPVVRTEEGLFAEAVVEWAPSWLHNDVLARADYTRATVRFVGYLPLLALDTPADRNRFSLWLAGSLAADRLTGAYLPADVRATTGGAGVLAAPGGAVRGYEPGRFDGTTKVIANAELRANLPALFLPGVVPGVFAFTDAGLSLDDERRSPLEAENRTVLLSSGAGLSLDLFEAVVFTFYTTFLWTDPTLEGRAWVPFSLGFGRHF